MPRLKHAIIALRDIINAEVFLEDEHLYSTAPSVHWWGE